MSQIALNEPITAMPFEAVQRRFEEASLQLTQISQTFQTFIYEVKTAVTDLKQPMPTFTTETLERTSQAFQNIYQTLCESSEEALGEAQALVRALTATISELKRTTEGVKSAAVESSLKAHKIYMRDSIDNLNILSSQAKSLYKGRIFSCGTFLCLSNRFSAKLREEERMAEILRSIRTQYDVTNPIQIAPPTLTVIESIYGGGEFIWRKTKEFGSYFASQMNLDSPRHFNFTCRRN